jgi:hypothetical protein
MDPKGLWFEWASLMAFETGLVSVSGGGGIGWSVDAWGMAPWQLFPVIPGIIAALTPEPEEDARALCDIDASRINSYIKSQPIYGDASLPKPLEGWGQALMDAAEQFDVDPSVLVAIGFQESHWGFDRMNDSTNTRNNAFGLKGRGGLLAFEDFRAAAFSAASTVRKVRKGNGTLSELYSGNNKPPRGEYGGYCTHPECPDAVKTLTRHVLNLGGKPSNTTFRCERIDNKLVMKRGY